MRSGTSELLFGTASRYVEGSESELAIHGVVYEEHSWEIRRITSHLRRIYPESPTCHIFTALILQER